MSIVKEMNFTVGKVPVTVRFADDAYRDAPPDEIQRRIDNMQEIAGKILARHLMETAG